MVRFFSAALVLAISSAPALAEPDLAAINDNVVKTHVVPFVQDFKTSAVALRQVAEENCQPRSPELVEAFHTAFNSWTRMSHLRFGPTETEDRAFAIAFWPDGRGKTPKALLALLKSEDHAIYEADAFRTTSIAARGLYAMEFLLFDDRMMVVATDVAHCHLIKAIATDTAHNAEGIAQDWQSYGDQLLIPSEGDVYRSDAEATQELYKALLTGLQFTSDTRLGRPLGTFDRPRPTRAELRRSGRSLKQVEMSLQGTRDLAMKLSAESSSIAARLDDLYATAFEVIKDLDDPVFAGVADVQGRLRVEILQISIDEIRELVSLELGPALGVAAGFNALDGD